MDSDLSFGKLKILYINVYIILLEAATLNLHKLQGDLRDVKTLFMIPGEDTSEVVVGVLGIFITWLILAKFVFGYFTLAGNVIALYPIFMEEQEDLLLPAIVCQGIENIALSFFEILLGFLTLKYYLNDQGSVFALLFIKLMLKISFSLVILNIYSNLYKSLKPAIPIISSENAMQDLSAPEEFVRMQDLRE